MDKTKILTQIRRERARLEAAVDRTPVSDRDRPVSPGGWSVKIAIAHVATWERLTLLRLEAALTGAEPQVPPIGTDEEIDAVNAWILETYADRPLEAVQAEFAEIHTDLVSMVEALDDEFLQRELPAPWGRGRTAWQLIGSNTWWHYPEHTEAIEN